ncbi:hypothetical protein ABIE66_005404 [Peribacillus sp. B2I2]|uniref:hypothetical protein n=1 Tax=Peribacillus sp. B2I2 TaxID=3156468 RepID=UPI0035124AEC
MSFKKELKTRNENHGTCFSSSDIIQDYYLLSHAIGLNVSGLMRPEIFERQIELE